MGRAFALQHAAAWSLCGTRDPALGSRHFRCHELLSGVAHTRDRLATRRRRTAATGVAARPEAGFLADDDWRRARSRSRVRVDTFVVRTAVWSGGHRCLDVCDDLAAACHRLTARVLLTGAASDADRSVERAAIRVEIRQDEQDSQD